MTKRHDNHNGILFALVLVAALITTVMLLAGCTWVSIPFTIGLAAVGIWKDLL